MVCVKGNVQDWFKFFHAVLHHFVFTWNRDSTKSGLVHGVCFSPSRNLLYLDQFLLLIASKLIMTLQFCNRLGEHTVDICPFQLYKTRIRPLMQAKQSTQCVLICISQMSHISKKMGSEKHTDIFAHCFLSFVSSAFVVVVVVEITVQIVIGTRTHQTEWYKERRLSLTGDRRIRTRPKTSLLSTCSSSVH